MAKQSEIKLFERQTIWTDYLVTAITLILELLAAGRQIHFEISDVNR